MCTFTFCLTYVSNILNIRIDSKAIEILAYLWLYDVKYQPNLKKIIKTELSEICKDFKMKDKRIKNAPDWLYE
jgi:hypothetical protein